MDRYLKAMLNQDVSADLFARNVRFTENGIELPLGNEGLWWGMSGLGGYRFYVPDVETQQVAMIGTVKENMANNGVNDDQGNNVAVAIRLKIVEGKITEIEQLAIRPRGPAGRAWRWTWWRGPWWRGRCACSQYRRPHRRDEGAEPDLLRSHPGERAGLARGSRQLSELLLHRARAA